MSNTERDWPEDFDQENGNYLHSCSTCALEFSGHKRRRNCKVCVARFEAIVGEAENKLSDYIPLVWDAMGMSGSPHADARKLDYRRGYIDGYLASRKSTNP